MTMIKPEMKEKIVRAAESLRSEGVAKPTNEQVRERMGGGSLSHISPVMREWRASQEQSDIVVIELPGELKAGFDRVAAELWQVASKLAAADIEAVKAHAAEHVAMADQERDEALDEVARLESELDRCRVAVSEKEAETRAALSEKITIEQKAIGLASEVERLTQELAVCRQSIESFTSDNATLTANLKAANQEIDKLAKANQDKPGQHRGAEGRTGHAHREPEGSQPGDRQAGQGQPGQPGQHRGAEGRTGHAHREPEGGQPGDRQAGQGQPGQSGQHRGAEGRTGHAHRKPEGSQPGDRQAGQGQPGQPGQHRGAEGRTGHAHRKPEGSQPGDRQVD
nr:hypothetical protein LEFNMAFB_00050 [uncultured bacterium]